VPAFYVTFLPEVIETGQCLLATKISAIFLRHSVFRHLTGFITEELTWLHHSD